jgi:CRISPR/Cas system-associated exonuclease Cas4 (RecB family)
MNLSHLADTAPFLKLVAADLIERFGKDLSQIAVVFPSRRARLFFNNYLYLQAGEPVWAPQYFTIEELFSQAAPHVSIADNIKLINLLYHIYIHIYNETAAVPSSETLDEFYFFGETLLNDFDDIDKNLANARSLFCNLEDLDALRDDFSHLNESQVEVLKRYFNSSFLDDTRLQDNFRSIWNILGKVYFSFKETLTEQHIAYPGMLMRNVVEKEETAFIFDHYVFAGFNVLNQCEQKLFNRLKDKSLFYWDYDAFYLNMKTTTGHEAGRFIREDIQRFGSALNLDSFNHLLSEDKQITMIASPSESGQAAYISPWIDSLKSSTPFIQPNTAIVLCNEQILPTVMHAIPPEKVEHVNITMGFPLIQTPVCSFIQVLLEMQVHGYVQSGKAFRYKYVLPVLRHPYTQAIFPEAKNVENELLAGNIFFPTTDILKHECLFTWAADTRQLAAYLLQIIRLTGEVFKKNDPDANLYSGLYQESIFQAYLIVNRLSGLIAEEELQIEKTTFIRLMKKLFAGTNIPFHGEPVKGLQVMGVLETRTLDFDNLLLLSVNEGFMPGSANDNTFIPQFIRKHFGLTTIEHQDSIYAYYFYRILQRAKHITLLYNTDKTQTGKAEMSRFLLQLLVDNRLKINRYSLSASIEPLQPAVIEIPKNDKLLQKIKFRYDLRTNPEAYALSPSAINHFIDCPLRFYLRYIEGIKPKNEMSDELDNSVFGTIFHRSAELLYRMIGRLDDHKQFNPFPVRKEDFELFRQKDSPYLDKLVARAFSEVYFKNHPVELKQYNGEQLINFRVIRHLLLRLIEFDCQHAPFYIYGLEHEVKTSFDLPEQAVSLQVGGIIDRLEEKNGTFRIVDYKTGGSAKTYKDLSELFEAKDKRAAHIFQTYLYASAFIRSEQRNAPVVPSLLYLQDAGKEGYSPVILHDKEEISDFLALDDDFKAFFLHKLQELFDRNIPFRQTEITKNCEYCDFKGLCNR